MSYQEHGLTYEEDVVLGAFDPDDPDRRDVLPDDLLGDEGAIRRGFRGLAHKGLATISLVGFYTLTRTGSRLWRLRAAEEGSRDTPPHEGRT